MEERRCNCFVLESSGSEEPAECGCILILEKHKEIRETFPVQRRRV
jgi:hypothetical protein